MERQGRGRAPLSALNNKAEANDASSVADAAEASNVEFTKEEVEALLNEKIKANRFDNKVSVCVLLE